MGKIIINFSLIAVMIIFSTIYYLEIIALPRFEQKFTICTFYYFFLFFSIIVIFRNLKELMGLKRNGMLKGEWEKWRRSINWHFIFRKLTFFAFCCGFILSITSVGFFTSSFIFMIIAMFLLGNRRYLSIFGISGGFVFLTYFIFVYLLHIKLPSGVLF